MAWAFDAGAKANQTAPVAIRAPENDLRIFNSNCSRALNSLALVAPAPSRVEWFTTRLLYEPLIGLAVADGFGRFNDVSHAR